MTDVVLLKSEALRVRRSIEDITRMLWAPVVGCSTESVYVTRVRTRLILAVGVVGHVDQQHAMRAAVKLGHVYAETSDVLHGRSRVAHFTMVRVAEWDADLARLIAVLPPDRQRPRETPPTTKRP